MKNRRTFDPALWQESVEIVEAVKRGDREALDQMRGIVTFRMEDLDPAAIERCRSGEDLLRLIRASKHRPDPS